MKFKKRASEILKKEVTKEDTVLDIGCGKQPYKDAIKGKCVSLDLVGKPEVIGTALHLPFKSGTFDVVVCFQVLPIIKESDNALKEMNRVLCSNSKLILSVSNTRTAKNNSKKDGVWRREYTEKTLISELEQAGFKARRITYPVGENNILTKVLDTVYKILGAYICIKAEKDL